MPKTVTGLSIEVKLLDEMKKLAKREDRTFSNYVSIVLSNHLKYKKTKLARENSVTGSSKNGRLKR